MILDDKFRTAKCIVKQSEKSSKLNRAVWSYVQVGLLLRIIISIFHSKLCAVFAGGSLRRLQLPGDRGGAGPRQPGLHQDVLQPDQAPPPTGPDPVRCPPAHRDGPAQRDRDGGQEPLRNPLCPQVCDEVHVLTKKSIAKKE